MLVLFGMVVCGWWRFLFDFDFDCFLDLLIDLMDGDKALEVFAVLVVLIVL